MTTVSDISELSEQQTLDVNQKLAFEIIETRLGIEANPINVNFLATCITTLEKVEFSRSKVELLEKLYLARG